MRIRQTRNNNEGVKKNAHDIIRALQGGTVFVAGEGFGALVFMRCFNSQVVRLVDGNAGISRH